MGDEEANRSTNIAANPLAQSEAQSGSRLSDGTFSLSRGSLPRCAVVRFNREDEGVRMRPLAQTETGTKLVFSLHITHLLLGAFSAQYSARAAGTRRMAQISDCLCNGMPCSAFFAF